MKNEPSTPPSPAPDPAELLAHSSWMRALARQVVADEQRADDAVQETWLRLLRQPTASVRHLSTWLASVVRHVAVQFGRSERRRVIREEASAAPERLASTFDVAARAELHRRVVDAVLALDEPYRSTILLRFFDRLPPRVIAQRAGIPVATVHTRLQRGLAQLRARLAPLDASRMWMLALPWEVLLMGAKTKIAAAAAALVIAAGATWVVLDAARADRSSMETALASPAISAAASTIERRADASEPAAAPTRVAEGPIARVSVAEANRIVFLGLQRVRGLVVDDEHAPIAGARVTFVIPGTDEYVPGVSHRAREELDGAGFEDVLLAPPVLSATTNALGEFEVGALRAGLAYRMHVTADGFGKREIAVPFDSFGIWFGHGGARVRTRSLTLLPEIVLVWRESLNVRVVDEQRCAVAGAWVWSNVANSESWRFLQAGNARGRTDARGGLQFELDERGPHWIAARDADGREATLATTADVKRDMDGAIVLVLRDDTPLDVTVRSSDGDLLSGLRVGARYDDPNEPGRKLDRVAITDDAGRCRFDHVPPVQRTLWVDASGGCVNVVALPPIEEWPTVAPEVAATILTVELEGPTYRVRFIDAATRAPVAASRLLVVQADGFEFLDPNGSYRDHAMPARGLGVVATESTTGRIYLAKPGRQCDGTPGYSSTRQRESFLLLVDAPGYARTRIGPLDPAKLDRSKAIELPLEHGFMLTGVVRDGDARPVPDARLHVPGAGPGTGIGGEGTLLYSTTVRSARTDADGRFELGPFAVGECEVVVRATDLAERRLALSIGKRGMEPLEIVLDRGFHVSGSVRLETDDDPSRFAVIVLAADRSLALCSGIAGDASFDLGPLPGGDFRLLAFALDFADPGMPVRFDGGRTGLLERELLKRSGLEPRAAVMETPGVALALSGDVAALVLEPLRGERGSRIELKGVLCDPALDLAAIEVYDADASELERCRVVVEDGRFQARVDGRTNSFIAIRERFHPDRRIWPDVAESPDLSWTAIGRTVTPEEIRAGAIELGAARGSLEIQLRLADGVEFERSAKFRLARTGGFDAFVAAYHFLRVHNGDGITLPIPADGRLRLDSIPAGSFTLHVFLHEGVGAKGIPIEVSADELTKLELDV